MIPIPGFSQKSGVGKSRKITAALDRQGDAVTAVGPKERVVKRIGCIVVHDLGFGVGTHRTGGKVVLQARYPRSHTDLVKPGFQLDLGGRALSQPVTRVGKIQNDLVFSLRHAGRSIGVT